MAKVRAVVPPELSREVLRGRVGAIAAPVIMEIRLRDGRRLTQRAEYFRGAPERPLTRDEVVNKFHECARMVLDEGRVEEVRQRVENLEDAPSLAALLTA